MYLALGVNEKERCYAYQELFRHKMDNALLHEIRDSVNQDFVLGRDDFKDKIEQVLLRKVRKGIAGRPCMREDEELYLVY